MKRIFDLLLVTTAFLFLSPIIVVTAIAIATTSRGSILYWSERVGINNKIFKMPKFRSMKTDTPAVATHKLQSVDSVLTPIGGFLRKSSLDELPQLFNVIQNEMSLVGPRPEMPFIVDNEYNDFYRERLQVKPGITGVWQISGDRTREIHENI